MNINSQADTPSAKEEPADDVRRFAVLCHTDHNGRHFDLLIEAGQKLATWKLDCPPEETSDDGIDCAKIPDHRRVYLEYEGPISGDRGEVTRHDEGLCVVHTCEQNHWEVTFQGKSLAARYDLRQSDNDAAVWRFKRI